LINSFERNYQFTPVLIFQHSVIITRSYLSVFFSSKLEEFENPQHFVNLNNHFLISSLPIIQALAQPQIPSSARWGRTEGALSLLKKHQYFTRQQKRRALPDSNAFLSPVTDV